MTEYSYIQMRPDCPVPDPIRESKADKTRGFSSHNGPASVRRITRDGEVVVIECVTSGRRVEVAWSAVAFARPMPKREEKPQAQAPAMAKGK